MTAPRVQVDAYLDPDTWDLPATSRLVTGIALVQQRIRLRLRRGTGEWFLDPSLGLPLIEWREQKPPQVKLIVGQVEAEIRLVPGVLATQGFAGVHDPAARRLTITGEVLAAGGEVTSVVATTTYGGGSGVGAVGGLTMGPMVFGVFFAGGSGALRGGPARPGPARGGP